jgi:ABC-2 type transport system permease protein
MTTAIPTSQTALRSLFRADMTTQWRNRRSFILVLIVPIMILLTFQNTVPGPFALSTSITLGLIAVGLMGYTNSLARDREKGIFQRLRVAPVPTWAIMFSRLLVQLIMILLVTVSVFIVGDYKSHIQLGTTEYLLGTLTSIIGGAVFLSLGQVIVALIINPETVFSTTRLVYFAFIVVGLFGESGRLGEPIKQVVLWSPYGTVKRVIAASMKAGAWTNEMTIALLVSIGYTIIFSAIGIRNFQWTGKK